MPGGEEVTSEVLAWLIHCSRERDLCNSWDHGSNVFVKSVCLVQVDQWLEFSKVVVNSARLASILTTIDGYLSLRSFLVGYSLSLADISIWGQLKGEIHTTAGWVPILFSHPHFNPPTGQAACRCSAMGKTTSQRKLHPPEQMV